MTGIKYNFFIMHGAQAFSLHQYLQKQAKGLRPTPENNEKLRLNN